MKLYITIAAILALTLSKAQPLPADSIGKVLLYKEYHLWQATTDSQRICLLIDKASLYRQQKKYDLAIKEIERGVTYVNESSVFSLRWKYEALINYFAANKFEKANTVLENFSAAQSKQIGKQKEYYYLRWSVFTETNQLQKSKNEMLLLCDSLRDTVLLKEISCLPIASKEKNPKKARVLSVFLPGTGSIYDGYPLKGAISFLTNASLLGVTALLAVNQLYVTAFVSGFLPFTKFYKGNIALANHLATQKTAQNNLRLKKVYYRNLTFLILKIEK